MAVRQVGASHSRVGFREVFIFFIIFPIPLGRGNSSIYSVYELGLRMASSSSGSGQGSPSRSE